MLNGWLNDAFNPNCPACRERYCGSGDTCELCEGWPTLPPEDPCRIGHFCSEDLGDGNCGIDGFTCGPGSCGVACVGCPGWEDTSLQLWGTVLAISVTSPLVMYAILPFLRGQAFGCGRCKCKESAELTPDQLEVTRRQSVKRASLVAAHLGVEESEDIAIDKDTGLPVEDSERV